jgi:succinyl-diaminopimelate desuccinylase
VPSARTLAAISFSAEFFAPQTRTVPSSGGPGRTRMRSCPVEEGTVTPASMVPAMREFVEAAAVVELTRRLVAEDTRNPPGNEQLAAVVAQDRLERAGATFQQVEPEPGRTSLVATVGAGDGSRPILIVNGHLDTVPVDATEWHHDPWGGEEVDGRVYGRGTTDMKGGIAASIEALATLDRAGVERACDVVFHLVADEELGGQQGTKVLLDRGLIRGDACIDPEPTSLGVCVAERGLLHVTISVRGRPAHGSTPHLGISAVEKAAKVVLALHGADFGDVAHDLLGTPTANAGLIAGGTAKNVVAEFATVGIDRRLLPGTSLEAGLASLRSVIDGIGDPDLHYEIAVDMFGEPSELDRSDPFLQTFQDAYTAVLGAPGPMLGMQFTTDARFVRNDAGIPAIVCGPGDLDQAHVVDESVSVERLVDATALYAQLYATFAG